ncbi:MAG: hypothetical protein ACRD6X_22435 [Pyrinomonadaceae bacterium]
MTVQIHSNLKWMAFLVVLFFMISTTDIFGQQNNPLLKTPNGNWSFGIYPYHGSDKQNFPVGVWQVTSEIDAGVGATSIGIVNNSNKTVAAVRFKWLLFEGENRDRILQQGSSPLLALRSVLEPENKKVLIYQVMSLLKIYRPLLRKNMLNGDFEAEIFVEEVYFTDNSIWKNGVRQDKQSNKSNSSELKITFASFSQCSKQKCKSNTSGSLDTVYYSCESSTFNEICSVASNARSCTVTNCGSGGVGGIEPETPIEYSPDNP